jgi:hypothetical protein
MHASMPGCDDGVRCDDRLVGDGALVPSGRGAPCPQEDFAIEQRHMDYPEIIAFLGLFQQARAQRVLAAAGGCWSGIRW